MIEWHLFAAASVVFDLFLDLNILVNVLVAVVVVNLFAEAEKVSSAV